MRRSLIDHPRMSADILGPLDAWGLPVDAVLSHHERLDGSGYPRGLEGDQLSIDAQILGACDMFEALVTTRPWREAATTKEALSSLSD